MRRRRLPRLLGDLLGHFDEQLVSILVGQIDAAIRGAELARRMTRGEVSPDAAREEMRDLEHQGDRKRAELVSALAAALTTPIDREDLFRFSRLVDDVLDGLRDFVRETDLYGLGDQESVTPVLDAVLEGLGTLREAASELAERPHQAGLTTVAAKKAANKVRRSYAMELAELFNQPFNVETMKRRELLRRIDVVGMRLSEAADALADGIIKRSS
ncbi:MAG: DUF47 family protein [Acidothermus sp.]|nr:DUF47 family protein [Acidothermus sp.]MCL6538143.1 DUF47 family protein [Acidothermus sp.]